MTTKIAIGDKVQLTGKFLRSTGQIASREGRKVWTVTGFVMSWAITDELAADAKDWFTAEEIAADPRLLYRKIAVANLKVYGKPSSKDA